MTSARRLLAPTATLLALALALPACVDATPPSHPVAASALFAAPPPGMARVVFLRHVESFGRHSTIRPLHVIDEHGTLLGDLRIDEVFSVVLPAGAHEFFAWHDEYANAHYVAAIRATVDAGRIYFVGAVRAHHAPWYQTVVEIDLDRAPVPLDGIQDLSPVMIRPESAAYWSGEAADEAKARIAEGRAKIAAGDFSIVRPEDGVVFNAPDAAP
jgi:hypothetical protein